MTVKELCKACDFTPVVDQNLDNDVSSVYSCDLLSWVVGRARLNAALVTVMTNVNVIAVASMADLSCIVLTEGVKLDEIALNKAIDTGIPVLSSKLDTFKTCALMSKYID